MILYRNTTSANESTLPMNVLTLTHNSNISSSNKNKESVPLVLEELHQCHGKTFQSNEFVPSYCHFKRTNAQTTFIELQEAPWPLEMPHRQGGCVGEAAHSTLHHPLASLESRKCTDTCTDLFIDQSLGLVNYVSMKKKSSQYA